MSLAGLPTIHTGSKKRATEWKGETSRRPQQLTRRQLGLCQLNDRIITGVDDLSIKRIEGDKALFV